MKTAVKSSPPTARLTFARVDRRLAILLFALSLGVYTRTLAPGLLFGDPGEFHFAAWRFGLAHPTGYPLYLLLGGAWQHLAALFGADPAFSLNLFSALLAATTVALFYLAVLAWLPQRDIRLVLGGLLLLAALLLRAGFSAGLEPSWRVRLATGLVSGFVNGVAAIGGMAVAVLMSTTSLAPAVMRATMIVLFLFTDLYALAWAAVLPSAEGGGAGLLGFQTLVMALALAPAMLAGIWCGRRFFVGMPPQAFRQRVLEVLIVIAGMGVLRAGVDLMR